MPKRLHVIAACSENRVIARKGRTPWQIPEDTAFFHAATAGQICVLGRVTYDAWPSANQDGRQPIVLASRPLQPARPQNPPLASPRIARSLAEALALAEALPGEIYICGGQRVFEETFGLPRPLRLHLTLVHAEIPGDRFFPEWQHLPWREIARRESRDANYRYTFFTLEK